MTRLFAAVITAPCKLIGNAKTQALGNYILLCFVDKGSNQTHLAAASQIYCQIHRLVKFDAAIRISVACSIIGMGPVVNLIAFIFQGNACRSRQEQAITERYISADRLTLAFLQLLCIRCVRNAFLRALEQRAFAVCKNLRQIHMQQLHMIIIGNSLRCCKLLSMLLTIGHRQGQNIITVFFFCQCQTG